MAIFTKGIIGSAVAGTIVLGAMVTWDGGTTVNSAKDKITQAATENGLFKTNETALVNKVTSLKTEKATLKAEVAALKIELENEKSKGVADKARIVELEAEIATKTAEIADLTAEIATLTNDLENAAGNTAEIVERINALEAELNAANAQAEELQYTLDTTVLESPDQPAVDAALSDEPGDVPVPLPVPTPINEIAMVGSTPMTLMTGVRLTKAESAGVWTMTLESENNDDHIITIDGVDQTLVINEPMIIGTNLTLDGKTLTVKNTFTKATETFILANK